MDFYSFYKGHNFDAHEYLGAHRTENGVTFRTFAPSASGVSLLLCGSEIPMCKTYDGNFYEVTIDYAKCGDTYEYRIYRRDNTYTDHSDPYAFQTELRPSHKSVICDLSDYNFCDVKWMKSRTDCKNKPLNIYEMHLGSWRKTGDDEFYNYREIADLLVPYIKQSGYNYVEFMPVCEYPCDESWGYQNTGFFSATSRYGKPTDLMYLVDTLHQNGIGVILDFVPVHFAVDEYGLSKYDGTALYEYPNSAVGVSEWGSYNFMHSRGEVRSFLQSSANFWLSKFHFDGLRMDAISRIIYWQGDSNRGVNGSALDFIKVMNRGIKQRNPGCMLIAEDSTNYPNVTKPVDMGGLGFDYKWDMGWMHDTLDYFRTAPWLRSENYHKLTFSMMYFYNENYLLPFSHDEVVHGKAAITQKMNGQYEEKFPQARAMYLYMMAHPGKKLNFMGNEIAQLREWDEKRQQDWDLRKYPLHDSFYCFMTDLNKLYLEHSALHNDYSPDNFEWADCHSEEDRVYAILRKSGTEKLLAVFNFDGAEKRYALKLCDITIARLLLNTDFEKYSGKSKEQDNFTVSNGGIEFDLAPFSGVLLEIE